MVLVDRHVARPQRKLLCMAIETAISTCWIERPVNSSPARPSFIRPGTTGSMRKGGRSRSPDRIRVRRAASWFIPRREARRISALRRTVRSPDCFIWNIPRRVRCTSARHRFHRRVVSISARGARGPAAARTKRSCAERRHQSARSGNRKDGVGLQIVSRITCQRSVATAGGVVFASSRDGNLIALDGKTGKYLWHYQTGGNHAASPISYAINGRQYVALTAGNVLYSFALPQ